MTGLPPHLSWPRALPNTRKHDWVPFTADQEHVLMARMSLGQRTGPTYIPLATVARTNRVVLVPSTEYPHYTLGRMQMEYPWIVGLRYTERPPDDWKLWAANVVTGHLLILDHGNGYTAPTTRQYPDFHLNGHRVIWDDAVYPTAQYAAAAHKTFLWNRLDLYNLDSGQKTVIASTSDGQTLYMQPTLWGNTVVWVRVTEPPGRDINPTYDLVRMRLGSSTVTNLTQNYHSGVSTEPSLWHHYLLFKQSSTPYSEGDIVLWDLSKRHLPLWRKPGSAVLESGAGEMPLWNGGVAVWQAEGQATSAVYLPGTGRTWTFQYGPHVDLSKYYKYTWSVAATGGGRSLVIERDKAGTRYAPTYFVWYFPSIKGGVCR
jgi:hypothetical protein